IANFAGIGQNVDSSAFGSGAKSYNNGTLMGVTSLNPFTNTVTLSSGFYHVDLMSTNFLVDDPSTGTVTLHYIDGRFSKGQIVRIRPVKGKTLTLKKASDLTGTKGNLYLDADVTLAENEFLDLTLSDDFGISGVGMYVVSKGGRSSSGFTNPATSDLDMNKFNILNVPSISFKNTNFDNAQRTINFITTGLQYYTDNSSGPTQLQHSFWIGLNNIMNIRAGEVDIFKTLNMENQFITNVNNIQFASTGGLIEISTSNDGQVINYTVNGLFNIFRMSSTANCGIMQTVGQSTTAAPAYKLYNGLGQIPNQILGTFNYDSLTGIGQKSFVVLSGMVATNGTSGKFLVSILESPVFPAIPTPLFSIDGSNGNVTCVGSRLVIDTTANDPFPNNLPLTIDTLGSFVSYANSEGHLFQNAAKNTFYFGAFKPNVFYQGISMVVNQR